MADLTNKQLLEVLRLEFATKTDLEKFATKDDLKHFATKEDLKEEIGKTASKEDLKKFATKEDLTNGLERLERKLDNHSRASVQHHLRILEAIGGINRQLTKLTESQEAMDKRFNRLKIVTE